jgi:hypothetical protein
MDGPVPDHRWAHCARCGYRMGRPPVAEPCRLCGHAEVPDMIPDVVGRQVVMNTCGLAARFCGRAKPYQHEADELTVAHGLAAPPRMWLSGSVRVHEQGGLLHERMNLLEWLSFGGACNDLGSGEGAADITLALPATRF